MSDSHPAFAVIHLLAGFTVLGTLAGALPPIAASLAIVWYLIEIWESDTARQLRRKRRDRHQPPS